MNRLRRSAIIIATARGYGGGERSLEELLVPLSRDFDVHFLVENRRHAARVRKILSHNSSSRVRELPDVNRLWQIGYGVVWLIGTYLRQRPSFVLANTHKAGAILALATLLIPFMGSKSVVYVRDFQWSMAKQIFAILRHALVMFPSDCIAQREGYLIPLLVPRGNIHHLVVPNIVAIDNSHPAPAAPQNPGLRLLVTLAGVQRWKGQEFLIRALARLPMQFQAIFYGDIQEPDYFADLLQLTKQLGVEDRVEFREFTIDSIAAIANSYCVVVTSISRFGGPETFGRTIVEAWSQSKPVIAFSAGGARDLIDEGQTGLLVAEGDIVGLAETISRLDANPDLAKQIGIGGNAKWRAEFTAPDVYRRFLNALRSRSDEGVPPR